CLRKRRFRKQDLAPDKEGPSPLSEFQGSESYSSLDAVFRLVRDLERDEAESEDPMAKDSFKALPIDTSEVKTPRFVCLSALLHAVGLVALVFISATQLNLTKEEVVIELADGSGNLTLPPAQMVAESQGTPAPVPEVESLPISQPAVTSTPIPEKAPVVAEKKAAPAPKAASVVRSEPIALPAQAAAEETVAAQPLPVSARVDALADTSDVEVPASLDDIESPELAAEPIATVVPFKEKVHRPDPKAVQKLEAVAQNAAEAFKNELQGESALDEGALSALEEKNAAEAGAMAAHLAKVRAENAKALESARQAKGAGGKGSEGQGGNDSGVAATGTAGGIRRLEHIRQLPGNPRPSYSEMERAQNQHGEVVFHAYVNKQGRPVQFKQIRSTGHANLDTKTLASLKQWKFYPGQEGWVEIPFKWDIRGGPQEMSALNRSQLSQKVD
ncbi:MAG TPA: TonB family protein, partial [Pseudobdellovibrionaceae bacterium]|nr:TonB family protein [Pseudobdellovibrionaceae bacterium]